MSQWDLVKVQQLFELWNSLFPDTLTAPAAMRVGSHSLQLEVPFMN